MEHRMGTPYYELLSRLAPVSVGEGRSSFFAQVRGDHDPRLFVNGTDQLRPELRAMLLDVLYGYWREHYADPEAWSTVWLAGSALTTQWEESGEELTDLDVLIGVDLSGFLKANPSFRGFSEKIIAKHMNTEFREQLWPQTANWNGFEVTFYVNPGTGTDIRAINPYAAYNLTTDEWTVRPPDLGEDWGPEQIEQPWWDSVESDLGRARELVGEYNRLAAAAEAENPGPRRTNLLHRLDTNIAQTAAHYRKIHSERSYAYQGLAGVPGQGYLDYYNFRWQMLKRAGLTAPLQEITRLQREIEQDQATARYGAPVAENVLTPTHLMGR